MACSGASKKFGGSVASADEIEMLSKISENTDYLITSSSQIEDYYREAFQIDRQKSRLSGFPDWIIILKIIIWIKSRMILQKI